MDGWLSWPCWLTDSGRFTHKVVTRPAVSLAQDRESSPARTGGLTTMLRHQPAVVLIISAGGLYGFSGRFPQLKVYIIQRLDSDETTRMSRSRLWRSQPKSAWYRLGDWRDDRALPRHYSMFWRTVDASVPPRESDTAAAVRQNNWKQLASQSWLFQRDIARFDGGANGKCIWYDWT